MTSILEGISLNGLELNTTAGPFGVEAIDLTPPKKKPEYAQGADSDGADLIRTPLYENRTITMTVHVTPQASMNAALEKVGEIVDQLQEAEKNPGGIPLVWTPANSTKTITFYVLTGEVTGIPVAVQGSDAGYFQASPKVNISLTCKPFGYGSEVEAAAAKSIETGLSVVVLTVPTVAGDVPAEGRLIVKDTAAVGRRFVEWGLENRYYNASTALVLDSEDMTPVGGAQSTALNSSGAYKRAGATKGTILTTLLPEPTICATTGILKHVGTFRVKARIVANSVNYNMRIRLSWQDGEGPMRANTWQAPFTNFFSELDLGVITIAPAITGTQKWLGQIEAYSSNTAAADTLHIDYLTLIPVAEGYGKARGMQPTAPTGTIIAFDNFSTGTLSGNLNARTPAVGSAWATSGATTDWTVYAGSTARKTTSDSSLRLGVFGSALGNSEMSVGGFFYRPNAAESGQVFTGGAILRWVDSSNYAFALIEMINEPLFGWNASLGLGVHVAGVTTILTDVGIGLAYRYQTETFNLWFAALLDGSLTATARAPGLASTTISGSHSSVATGGALASGKGGILSRSTGGLENEHGFRGVNYYQLANIPYCVRPSKSMEVRSDSTLTADSSGTYYGPPPQYRGSRFYVPEDGSANRTSRIVVKADRNDLEESDQSTIADAFTAEVRATPRYLVIPR